jgi:hypothetical protein
VKNKWDKNSTINNRVSLLIKNVCHNIWYLFYGSYNEPIRPEVSDTKRFLYQHTSGIQKYGAYNRDHLSCLVK